ncbi:MAG: hypothetical protein J5819_02120 [Eubacterium sp.]|nr:hypothetical protein [Eubacterium sp.]
MTVNVTIDELKPLTDEQKKELDELDNYPIEFDEDCPEFSDDELKGFQRVNPQSVTSQAASI